MKGSRRIVAISALAALLITAFGGLGLAEQGSAKVETKVSAKFKDMGEYSWGLGDVVRLMVSGVFKGRSETEFAPGAAITRQEMAVAAVRLMGQEAAAQALTEAQVEALLSQVADAGAIAAWAKGSVALLVQLGAVEANQPFRPTDEATRLDVAVLLVKILGFEAEAQAKMNAQLTFTDGGEIPTHLVGYVAAALDHGLIKGYTDGQFKPERAVKRVEMAVMMGRADRQTDSAKGDEVKGTVSAVDQAAGSITLTVNGQSLSYSLTADAAVFVNHAESSLAEVAVGMKAELKLNAEGKALFVEAEAVGQSDPHKQEFIGTITGLTAGTGGSLNLVEIDGTVYPLSATALIKLKGDLLTFADLMVGETVEVHLLSGTIVRLGLERESSGDDDSSDDSSHGIKVIEGELLVIFPEIGPGGEMKITVSYTREGEAKVENFIIRPSTEILLNGSAATALDLLVSDAVRLTVDGKIVTRLEITR
ncbi:MAG: S-layer homology domain-containing protein [Bacillota bacterium]